MDNIKKFFHFKEMPKDKVSLKYLLEAYYILSKKYENYFDYQYNLMMNELCSEEHSWLVSEKEKKDRKRKAKKLTIRHIKKMKILWKAK